MPNSNLVAIVEDDDAVRDAIRRILADANIRSLEYVSAIHFFQDETAKKANCVIMDIRMPDMTGIDAYKKMIESGFKVPVVFITGHANIRLAVDAIKLGAVEFLEKPFNNEMLVNAVASSLNLRRKEKEIQKNKNDLLNRFNGLTNREKSVFIELAQGHRVKEIAGKLDLSPRTVELYRARIGQKLEAASVPHLTLIAIELELIR